jgi:hypothetical protein
MFRFRPGGTVRRPDGSQDEETFREDKVLFVDEAYRLSQGHFAQEAVDEVVGLMTNEKFMNKMVIIFAGYEKEMNTLLGVNPGLASRLHSKQYAARQVSSGPRQRIKEDAYYTVRAS